MRRLRLTRHLGPAEGAACGVVIRLAAPMPASILNVCYSKLPNEALGSLQFGRRDLLRLWKSGIDSGSRIAMRNIRVEAAAALLSAVAAACSMISSAAAADMPANPPPP